MDPLAMIYILLIDFKAFYFAILAKHLYKSLDSGLRRLINSAVICNVPGFSALNQDVFVIPIWMLQRWQN